MEFLHEVEVAADIVLFLGVAAIIAVALDLYRNIRRMDAAVAAARLYTLTRTDSKAAYLLTVGLALLIAGLVFHGGTEMFAGGTLDPELTDATMDILAASGFALLAWGLSHAAKTLRGDWSPLVRHHLHQEE